MLNRARHLAIRPPNDGRRRVRSFDAAVPNAHAWFYVDARTIDGQDGALTERDDDLRGILGWCLATRISCQSVLDYGRKWRLHHNNSHGRAGGLGDFDHLLLLVIHF